MHRPDFYEYRKGSSPEQRGDTARRACFMWPYINQADLLNKNVLPLLINARGRHPPSYFAAADNRAMRLGFITGGFTSFTLCRHIMTLNGMTENTREYGKVMAWNDHPIVFNWMKEHKQFRPGEGLLVLEAQERVLAILVECCEEILHYIPKSSLTSSTFPVLPEPPLKPESNITGLESLKALMRFKFFVTQIAKGPLDTLTISVLPSPTFRKLFRLPPPDSETSEVSIVKKPRVELNGHGQLLLWLLRQSWEDSSFLFVASLPIMVDELNRLIQSEPEA
ncbi:hypothetical protein N7540_006859 [Penicillium herquei]|nr:hypothetical protein N7540_006859 [Penicillium herquei]